MSHESIASTFDQWAADGRDAGMESGHGDVVAQILDQLDIAPGARILDLGCGNGWATRELAKKAAGTQAIGVDVSPQMIARADELHSFTIRARYELGSFEALDFKDASFDLAFSMEAMYYAVDLGKALSELARVLKPGATAHVIVDYYTGRPGVEGWSEATGLALHAHTDEEWAKAFTDAGFASAETSRVVDRRGSGDEASFEPSPCHPDWASKVEFDRAGSLWIRATR